MTRTLLAALATLLVLTGCGQQSPAATPPATPTTPTGPPTYDDLPEGPATDLPWWEDGVLHVDGTTIPTRLSLVLHRDGTTLVGRTRHGRGADWRLVRAGRLVTLVDGEAPIVPLIGPGGRRVVWAEVDGDVQRVTAYDVAAGEVAGTWTTSEPVSPYERVGAVGVREIDADGRVLLHALWDRERWTAWWDPGADPVRADVDVPADDERVDFPEDLRLPVGVTTRPVAWDSPATVVVEARRTSGSWLGLLRCDAGTHACERVADAPGEDAVLPDPYA